MFNQLCRLVQKTCLLGAGNSESPKAPTATATRVGFRSGSQYTVEPHTGQKMESNFEAAVGFPGVDPLCA